MRPDMDKVLCERPRKGGGEHGHNRYYDDIARDPDNALSFEPIKHRGERKQLNENLKPLWGFLRSRLGRSWNNVYAEIREHFDKSSATKLHIFQHLEQEVELNAEYRSDGKYYEPNAHRLLFKDSKIIGKTHNEVSGFFVDRMGMLRENVRWRYRSQKVKNENVIKVSDRERLVRVNGSWFLGMFEQLPAEEMRWREYTYRNDRVRQYAEKFTPSFRDVYLKNVDAYKCVEMYGERVYCVSMRQLGKRDLKKYRELLP